MDRIQKLYSDFYDKYVKANTPEKTKAVCQGEVNEKWKHLKPGLVNEIMLELDEKIQKKGDKYRKGTIFSFLKIKYKERVENPLEDKSDIVETAKDSSNAEVAEDLNQDTVVAGDNLDENENARVYPGQDKLKMEIEAKKLQIVRLEEAMNLGLSSVKEIEKKKIKTTKEIMVLTRKLKKLETDRKAMNKLRAGRKEVE